MSSTNEHGMMGKIDDLTQSLSRTTDVLSTADRMIDHYRNLNSEQEYVIAKLKEDLQYSTEVNRHKNTMEEELLKGKGAHKVETNREREPHLTLRDTKQSISSLETSSDQYSDDGDNRSRRKPSHSPKVKFKDIKPTNDKEIELLRSTMTDFKQKQESLESDLRKERHLHEEEINRLDTTLKRQLSFELSTEKSELNDNLKKIQQKLEEDHAEYNKQQAEVQNITQEMKTLKDMIQEAAAPRKTEITTEDTDIDRKLTSYKRKLVKQDDIIKILKEQLENRTEEARGCESTVYKMQSLEKVKSQQLKLAEGQLSEEKGEKLNILKELESTQQKLSEANTERSELLYHLSDVKNETKTDKLAYEQCAHKLSEMKSLLEESEKEKHQLSAQVDSLSSDLQLNNNAMINKLKSQLSDYTANFKNVEAENQTLAGQIEKLTGQIEEVTSQYHDMKVELQSTKQLLLELKQKCKEVESSKHAVKEKAMNTLREYRNKYRKLEKQIQNHVEQQKTKEIELSKAISVSNEQEIANLRLKKELQDFTNEIDNLKKILVESESRSNQLSYEKSELEDVLTKSNEQAQVNYLLQREIHEYKNENQSLLSQVADEKSKRQEVQSLLQEHYEKNISSKEDHTSMKERLEEQRNKLQGEYELEHKRSQEALKFNDEQKLATEDKYKELSRNHENTIKTLRNSEESLIQMSKENEDIKKKLKEQELELEKETEKIKVLTQKLRKVMEENKKVRKQFHVMKDDLSEKLRNFQSNASMYKEPNILVQKDVDAVQNIDPAGKDEGIAKIFTILLQDSENLPSLLSYEDENVPNVKVVPLNLVSSEHRKAILEIREKYQTCYSITKTLKGRFQQQKNLIKRAQEKIKSQIQQIRILNDTRGDDSHNTEKITTLEVLRKSEQEKITFLENLREKDQEKIESVEKLRKNDQEKISSLETLAINDREKISSLEVLKVDSQKIIDSNTVSGKAYEEKIANLEVWRKKDIDLIKKRDAEITDLKLRMHELTRDLEGCTRALHKSIEVDKERRSVLNEIELLKSEHREHQQIDENFFRCSEKIESLTEQLNEAKNSLNEIKQDSVSKTVTTNRLIESFGSVSPSRKRRMYLFDSPLFKTTTKDYIPNDSILASPTRDTDNVRNFEFNTNDTLEDILPDNIRSKENTLDPLLEKKSY